MGKGQKEAQLKRVKRLEEQNEAYRSMVDGLAVLLALTHGVEEYIVPASVLADADSYSARVEKVEPTLYLTDEQREKSMRLKITLKKR